VTNVSENLAKFNASWERRAQVRRTSASQIDFDPSLPDFPPELLPPALAQAFPQLPADQQRRLLTYGWLAFNRKAIDVEHHVLVPACLRLLQRDAVASQRAASEAISQALVDEAYHIHLVRQASARTLVERGLAEPRFPLSRTVARMNEHHAAHDAPWQHELTLIGAAIVTEVFIKGYLTELSVAEHVQPLCMLTTRAHLADEAVHASVFVLLAELLYTSLDAAERDFFADVLIRAMAWFPDPEHELWEVAIRAAALPSGGALIARCRAVPAPVIDYAELVAFLQRVGVDAPERRVARAQAARTDELAASPC
jgi:alpha-N-dichloroacetyl-p-aminophenylserinol N-oxygenase